MGVARRLLVLMLAAAVLCPVDAKAESVATKDRVRIETLLKREIEELFHGRNLDG